MTTTKESLEEIKKYLCSGNPVWDVDEVAAVMDEAIAAAEKQTAKKPAKGYVYAEWLRKALIAKGKAKTANLMGNCCPSCGKGIAYTINGRGYPYCHNCGQKIDWEGREENGLDG